LRRAVAAILLLGVLLRLRGVFTDFWLDEIWGLRIALDAPSWWALLTRIHADTNHPLVSIFMHALGPLRHWEWYRAFSFACGVGTMFLVRDRTYRVLAALSFPLIVYSSEARGYAPAAFFLLLAYVTKRRWVFGVAIILAILSHLSAVAVYLGFLAADVFRWRTGTLACPPAQGQARVPVLHRHALPIAFGAWYFFVKVRHLVAGGGPRWTPDPFALLIAAITLTIVVIEIIRRRDGDAIFFAVAIVAGPLIAAASYRCPCVLPRHFFVCMPFVLILFASFFARVPKWGIAVFIVLNAIQIVPFMLYGRGQYDRALHDISGTVGGDSAFRDRMLIDFYNPSLRYVPRAQKPEWLLIENPKPIPGYTPWRTYPYGGVSGWTWTIYRLSKPDSIHK
jgi:multisubunit Na+/H+ antiporter MnhF subunit